MSTAVSTSNNASSWQYSALGMEDFGYTATGAGASVSRGSAQPGWVVAAMFLALATGPCVTRATAFHSLVGTGRSADNLISEDRTDVASEESWDDLFERIDERTTAVTTEVLAGADLTAEIKSTLSVSVTDLASIAGVSRQAVYDWISGGQVSGANYERLLKLRQVCMDWRSLANRPLGRLLCAKSADGYSLLDLLRQDPLDRRLIAAHLKALAEKVTEHDKQRRARNTKLVPLSEKDQFENALTHAIPATHS